MKKIIRLVLMSSVLWRIGAMENDVKTLEKILNPNNESFEALNNKKTYDLISETFEKSNEGICLDTPGDIKEVSDVQKFIKDNKNDILWPLKLGTNARREAYNLGKSLYNHLCCFNRNSKVLKECALDDYIEFMKNKKMDDKEEKEFQGLDKIFRPEIVSFIGNNRDNMIYKINKDFDFSRLLKVYDIQEYNDNYIGFIGRKVLHGITKDIYKDKFDGEDKAVSEFKRLWNGEMNCTCNATILYMFLKLNGIWCKLCYRPGHEFVLIELRKEKEKMVAFCSINLYEGGTIDEMSFDLGNIIGYKGKNKIWDGICHVSTCGGRSWLFSDYNYTPTYVYYDALCTCLDNAVSPYYNTDIGLVQYYLNGLKYSLKYLIKQKHTDGKSEWDIRFLPRKGNICVLLLNVFDLGEPKILLFENSFGNYRKLSFKSLTDPNKYVRLMSVDVLLPKDWTTNLKDCRIKVTNCDISGKKVKYNILNKDEKIVESGGSKVYGIIEDNIIEVCEE